MSNASKSSKDFIIRKKGSLGKENSQEKGENSKNEEQSVSGKSLS